MSSSNKVVIWKFLLISSFQIFFSLQTLSICWEQMNKSLMLIMDEINAVERSTEKLGFFLFKSDSQLNHDGTLLHHKLIINIECFSSS